MTNATDPSEKDATLAHTLAQLQPFLRSHRNALANLYILGQPNTLLTLARLPPFEVLPGELYVIERQCRWLSAASGGGGQGQGGWMCDRARPIRGGAPGEEAPAQF